LAGDSVVEAPVAFAEREEPPVREAWRRKGCAHGSRPLKLTVVGSICTNGGGRHGSW
jgi:hypothetical protein